MILDNNEKQRRKALGLPPRKPNKNRHKNSRSEYAIFYVGLILCLILLIIYLFY